MKKKKNAKTCRILILIISIFLLTGCTTTLVDSKKQAVKNLQCFANDSGDSYTKSARF